MRLTFTVWLQIVVVRWAVKGEKPALKMIEASISHYVRRLSNRMKKVRNDQILVKEHKARSIVERSGESTIPQWLYRRSVTFGGVECWEATQVREKLERNGLGIAGIGSKCLEANL